jgi:hypothetical protein
MYAGFIAIAIQGTIKVGGVERVWEIAEGGGRLVASYVVLNALSTQKSIQIRPQSLHLHDRLVVRHWHSVRMGRSVHHQSDRGAAVHERQFTAKGSIVCHSDTYAM